MQAARIFEFVPAGATGSPRLQEERQSLLRRWLRSQPSAPGAGAPKPGGGALSQQQLEFIVALRTQERERGAGRQQEGTEEEQELWEDWREAERKELDWRWPARCSGRGGSSRSASSSQRRPPKGRRDGSEGSVLRWRALQEEEEEEEPAPCVSRGRARRLTPTQKGRGTQGRGGLANGRLPRSSRRPHVISLGGRIPSGRERVPGGPRGGDASLVAGAGGRGGGRGM